MKRILIAAAVLMAACQPLPANDGKTDLAEAAPATGVKRFRTTSCSH